MICKIMCKVGIHRLMWSLEGVKGLCPGIRIPASSAIFELVNKVHTYGSFLDKKYTRRNTVLIEERLHKIGAR
jgi:hypothetical protein